MKLVTQPSTRRAITTELLQRSIFPLYDCYRHEEGVVPARLPSKVGNQIIEATYQPRLPDLR
jgi:hypothetical protein